eukprot:7306803-Prymnesium_polylepis.1
MAYSKRRVRPMVSCLRSPHEHKRQPMRSEPTEPRTHSGDLSESRGGYSWCCTSATAWTGPPSNTNTRALQLYIIYALRL